MSEYFSLEHISGATATAMADGRWRVTFCSTNPLAYHQLYVNGQLADWTDDPSRRYFDLSPADYIRRIVIAAVDVNHRTEDFSYLLGDGADNPWMHLVRVVRSVHQMPGDVLEIFAQDADGVFDSVPTVSRQFWPGGVGHWGWGLDSFGLGACGIDAYNSPGFGKGDFGAGHFGMDAEFITVNIPLRRAGENQIRLRTRNARGVSSADTTITVTAAIPPSPPKSINIVSYDPNSQLLSISIQ